MGMKYNNSFIQDILKIDQLLPFSLPQKLQPY